MKNPFKKQQNQSANSLIVLKALKAKADRKRTVAEKSADIITKIFGSITFLSLNVIWFAAWMVINLGYVKSIPAFDPFPFGLLTMIVSLEAIVLAIIVLISQNRAGKVEDLREEVDLHIDVVTEQEVTKALEILTVLAAKNGIDLSRDIVLNQMNQQLNIEKIESILETQVNEN